MSKLEKLINNFVRDMTAVGKVRVKSETRDRIWDILEEHRTLDAPMGVSQWRNHGEKYCYRKFFDEQTIKKWIKNHPDVWHTDETGTPHFWWVQNLLGDLGIDINKLAEDEKRK